jgi:hypothetical protein
MSIKPVEFQVMIPRTVDVAKMRNDELQKNAAMAQQQSAAVQNKAEDSVRQVYSRSKTEEVRINDKQRENSRQEEDERKGKKQNDPGKNKGKSGTKYRSTLQTSTIDIKI